MIENLSEILYQGLKLHPDKTAIIEDKKQYTFRDIDLLSNSLAFRLKTDFNIHHQDRVVVIAEKSINIILSAIAIWKLGAIYVPVDKSNGVDRIQYLINNVDAKLIISTSKIILNNIAILSNRPTLTYEQIKQIAKEQNVIHTTINTEDIAVIIHTSGSTGYPKGVMLDHRSIIAYFKAHNELLNFDHHSIIINFGEFHFDISIQDTFQPLFFGATVVLFKGLFLSKLIINLILNQKVTHLIALSSVLSLIAAHKNELVQLQNSNLKVCQTGGEICDIKLINQWKELLPNVKLINGYGPTECNSLCMGYIIEEPDYNRKDLFPIGTPFSNMEAVIINDKNEIIVNDNEIGILCISGPQLMKGYWNAKEQTNKSLQKINNKVFYITGDLAKRTNGLYYFEGRKDSEVKILGKRINLNEVRNRILLNSFIDYAVVSTIENNIFVYAHISSPESANAEHLLESLKKYLPSYMFPKYIYLTEKIWRTSTNKIDEKVIIQNTLKAISNNTNKQIIIE